MGRVRWMSIFAAGVALAAVLTAMLGEADTALAYGLGAIALAILAHNE